MLFKYRNPQKDRRVICHCFSMIVLFYLWSCYVINYWLVVWLPFFIFPYIGNNHPNWLIFFRGVQTTNQIICFRCQMYFVSMCFPMNIISASYTFQADVHTLSRSKLSNSNIQLNCAHFAIRRVEGKIERIEGWAVRWIFSNPTLEIKNKKTDDFGSTCYFKL